MSKCPICNEEASEAEINRHLDNGCPPEGAKPAQKLFSFGIPKKVSGSGSGSGSSQSTPSLSQAESNIGSQPELTRKRVTDIVAPDDSVKFKSKRKKVGLSMIPFAEQVRPHSLDDYVGQDDLVGPQGVLRKFVEKDVCPSIILWGPSGVGKTTFARILAGATKARFVELSATAHGINDVKKVIDEAKNEQKLLGRRTILFLDEIHRYNRAQQDVFLPHVERGDITLIGATTENPSFKLNGALLSRCRVFVLHKLTADDIFKILNRSMDILNENRHDDGLSKIIFQPEILEYMASLADGDGRIALNILEISIAGLTNSGSNVNGDFILDNELVKKNLHRTHMLYDRVGDSHYDTISAFHKSVRGSDTNATLFYLGRMLESGEDPLYVARRMIRIASEDIGLADDSILPFTVATYTAVQQVGMPEADCILAHCAVKLAQAPKSVKVYKAYNAVKALLKEQPGAASAAVPLHIRNAPTKLMKELDYGKEYKYNPDYSNGKVKQDYLPEGLKDIDFMPKIHLGTMRDPDLDN